MCLFFFLNKSTRNCFGVIFIIKGNIKIKALINCFQKPAKGMNNCFYSLWFSVFCVSGGGRPEASEISNPTPATNWTNPAKAINEAKPWMMVPQTLTEEKQNEFSCFILIIASFYLKSMKLFSLSINNDANYISKEKKIEQRLTANEMKCFPNLIWIWCLSGLIVWLWSALIKSASRPLQDY